MFILSDITLTRANRRHREKTSDSPTFLDFQLVNIQWNTKHETSASNAFWLFESKMCSLARCQNPLLSNFVFFTCCICKTRFIPRELCRRLTVFKVPTCCSCGKINVEQAKGRNAFKAPLIELDSLQSQKQSVSTRLGLVRSWDVSHTYTSLNCLLWLAAHRYQWTLQRQWELYGKVVWKGAPPLLQNESPLAVNEGEVVPCWGPLGWPLNRGTFLSNSVWPEPNILAEGHWIQSTTYREEMKGVEEKLGKSDVEEWEAKWRTRVGEVKGNTKAHKSVRSAGVVLIFVD